MDKEANILLRVTPEQKKRWQVYVDQLREDDHYDISLSMLIRLAVEKYIEARERPTKRYW
jgi:hypothetical protein